MDDAHQDEQAELQQIFDEYTLDVSLQPQSVGWNVGFLERDPVTGCHPALLVDTAESMTAEMSGTDGLCLRDA